jgi:hypothetical protein
LGAASGFRLFGGDLDAQVLTSVRREQRKLRTKLLGQATTASCALCGRTVPGNCIRTAHIKRRATCNEQERRDLANVMFACTLGCDHLFELGYIYVDESGTIQAHKARSVTPDLQQAIERVTGRTCEEHTSASDLYFTAHRELLGV